ncbi:MAG: 7-cyano-7-deazaguanine synthase [Candidatus Omnitrophica bacterium]|nr:7-cyano-7-deazaguanine synthase [Candidatus Omnitrophota bacterium]
MANFIAVVDPNAERRAQFLAKAESEISFLDGLTVSTCKRGDFASIWAAHESAPISVWTNETAASIIWGDAIGDSEGRRVTASELKDYWRMLPDQIPTPYDGFHAAVSYDSKRGLTVGADILGFFPIYYYAVDDVVLVGSSPELFKHHPIFEARFNPRGLIGILLTNGIFNGETLWSGVKRLDVGCLVSWKPYEGPRELRQYSIPLSNRYLDASFAEHVELVDIALEDAVRRHCIKREEPYGVLLSGGVDSRLLSGYMKRIGLEVKALTFGKNCHIEVKCAKRIAEALNIRQTIGWHDLSAYPNFAAVQCKWEHLADGFSNVWGWGIYRFLRNFAPRFVAGYSTGSNVGGPTMFPTPLRGYAVPVEPLTFNTFFANLNRWAIEPDVLKSLFVGESMRDLIDAVLSEVQQKYESYSDSEFKRTYAFELHHRERFHVGGLAWKNSFGSWPILPTNDMRLMEVLGGLPASTLAARRLEYELVRVKFPGLASIPLDVTCRNAVFIEPRLRHLLSRFIGQKIAAATGWLNRSKAERRYYHDLYNFNDLAWKSVRKTAEQNRKALLEEPFLLGEKLNMLLPASDINMNFKDAIKDSSASKLLLGFSLWYERNRHAFQNNVGQKEAV